MELSDEYKQWLHLRFGEEADRLLEGYRLLTDIKSRYPKCRMEETDLLIGSYRSLTEEQWIRRMDLASENDSRPMGSGNSERILRTCKTEYSD